MSLLQIRIGVGVLALLALLTLRRQRWAYFAFILLGLAYFPAQAHFHVALHFPKCEQLISQKIVLLSLRDYVHIALFAGFYWISWVQFRQTDARVLWAVLATLAAGALLEIVEGMSGRVGPRAPVLCRVRDLVPAGAGALGAAVLLAIWSRLTRKPGYVRLVKKGQAVAAKARRVVVPLPPPPRPLEGLPTVPTERVVPRPADFSPTAPEPSPEPTAEVARVASAQPRITKEAILRKLRAIPQRLRAIRLGAIPHYLLAMLQRLWGIVRARRRAIVIGIGVLLLVGGAAIAALLLIPAPAPTTVAEQPAAALPPPPPPPPRPLQVEAEGYYEPDYKFTIEGRRFLRLTLRPQASVTFAKYGGRQQDGCGDARIGPSAVYVRCEVERVGIVMIDGRFTSRYATNRLDAGVLSAAITVTNPRGEVLYRARDSFRWHEPD